MQLLEVWFNGYSTSQFKTGTSSLTRIYLAVHFSRFTLFCQVEFLYPMITFGKMESFPHRAQFLASNHFSGLSLYSFHFFIISLITQSPELDPFIVFTNATQKAVSPIHFPVTPPFRNLSSCIYTV